MSRRTALFYLQCSICSAMLLLTSLAIAQSEISSSLQLVVAAMRGGEYQLAPGTYTLSDTLTINDTLKLVGAGKDATIINLQKAPLGIRVSEDIDVHFEGISFRYSASKAGDIMHLAAGRFNIIGCDFQDALLGQSSDQATPFGYGTALVLTGQARGSVRESSFAHNGLAAIQVRDSADLELLQSHFTANTAGLFANGENQLRLVGNTFRDHSFNAMQLRGTATATVQDSVFDTNGTLNTDKAQSADAVRISDEAKVIFENTSFIKSPRYALSLSHRAIVEGQGNTFENNGDYNEALFIAYGAILLENESQISLVSDALHSNPGGAIELIDSSKANLEGVSIQGNGSWSSLYATNGSELTLKNSKVQNNQGYIYLKDSKGTFDGNQVTNNADAGIVLDGAAEATLNANTIASNADFGVIIQGKAKATLTKNILSENRSGIVLFGKSYANILNNQIDNHQRTGIAFLEDSGGIARENTLKNNLWNGILVGDNASARLESNTLQDNTLRGILYGEAGTGSATDNIISGSKVGIHLGGQAAPALDNNTFNNNTQDTYTGAIED